VCFARGSSDSRVAVRCEDGWYHSNTGKRLSDDGVAERGCLAVYCPVDEAEHERLLQRAQQARVYAVKTAVAAALPADCDAAAMRDITEVCVCVCVHVKCDPLASLCFAGISK
jgi:hypothetical protein